MAKDKMEMNLEELLEQPFEGVGKLYSALNEFKKNYCAGFTKDWPNYWSTFSDQAFADLIAMETNLSLDELVKEAKEVVINEYNQ